MAKTKSLFTCTECGGQTLRWQGQCPHCSSWNTLVETLAETTSKGNRFSALAASGGVQLLSEIKAEAIPRMSTGIAELDRVLGGGMVPGGVVLIGGDPGIGKSTLLLQALAHMGATQSTLYVSGEESLQQIALRAQRLQLEAKSMKLLAEIQLEKIQIVLAEQKPKIAVIDSIQTVYT
ncbi:MAG: AAA family ATPase, partial [Pseudomonadota bacterium]|nr:AAA family ATPase [Pseudomonadota bacterium]